MLNTSFQSFYRTFFLLYITEHEILFSCGCAIIFGIRQSLLFFFPYDSLCGRTYHFSNVYARIYCEFHQIRLFHMNVFHSFSVSFYSTPLSPPPSLLIRTEFLIGSIEVFSSYCLSFFLLNSNNYLGVLKMFNGKLHVELSKVHSINNINRLNIKLYWI